MTIAHQQFRTAGSLVRTFFMAVAASALAAPVLSAQASLGAPFIGSNHLSFYSAEMTRSGGIETTTTYGLVYGHRFGVDSAATRATMNVRGAARALDDDEAGVLDLAAQVGVAHELAVVPGLAAAASTGVGMMAWGDDIARTGRLKVALPVNAGVSYAFRVRGATIEPFVQGTVAYYDLRTARDDVRESVRAGWDANHTIGASIRLKEIVATSSRVIGEYGMATASRWTFSAGISF